MRRTAAAARRIVSNVLCSITNEKPARHIFGKAQLSRPPVVWRRGDARPARETSIMHCAQPDLVVYCVCCRTQMRLLMPAKVQVSCDVRCPNISRHICYSMCPQSIYPCARLHDHRQRIDRCGAHTAQKSDGVIVVHMCMRT